MKEIIAMIWRAWSGKDLAGDYLAEKLRIPSFTISEGLRIRARQRWIEESREKLIDLWKEYAQKYWDDYLAKIIIENTSSQKIIITWMRQIWQLEYCKKYHKTIFIWINSKPEIRYKRLVASGKFSWNYKEFFEIEKLDESKIQNVWKCLKYCETIIENNWSIEELEYQLEKIFSE